MCTVNVKFWCGNFKCITQISEQVFPWHMKLAIYKLQFHWSVVSHFVTEQGKPTGGHPLVSFIPQSPHSWRKYRFEIPVSADKATKLYAKRGEELHDVSQLLIWKSFTLMNREIAEKVYRTQKAGAGFLPKGEWRSKFPPPACYISLLHVIWLTTVGLATGNQRCFIISASLRSHEVCQIAWSIVWPEHTFFSRVAKRKYARDSFATNPRTPWWSFCVSLVSILLFVVARTVKHQLLSSKEHESNHSLLEAMVEHVFFFLRFSWMAVQQ